MSVIEPKIKELPGPSRLSRGFFNSLIRRVECTKPVEGDGIILTQQEDGIEVAINPENAVTITVCSAGEVKRLVLFYDAKRSQQATEEAGLTWP